MLSREGTLNIMSLQAHRMEIHMHALSDAHLDKVCTDFEDRWAYERSLEIPCCVSNSRKHLPPPKPQYRPSRAYLEPFEVSEPPTNWFSMPFPHECSADSDEYYIGKLSDAFLYGGICGPKCALVVHRDEPEPEPEVKAEPDAEDVEQLSFL